MNRKSEVAGAILVALLTLAAIMAVEPEPAVGEVQAESSQQVSPQHDVDQKAGPENRTFPFLFVYLWKDDGDWDATNCIGVFPNPAVISKQNNKPHKIRWVILEKDAEAGESEDGWSVDFSGKYHWSIDPKPNKPDPDLIPPKDKVIKKGHNSFKSNKPGKKGLWEYEVTVCEKEENGDCCTLDPKVRVRG